MILFVGQVERAMRGRGAFQEMDYRALFGSIDEMGHGRDRFGRRRSRKLSSAPIIYAMQGRPGPVVIALPEDVLTETWRKSLDAPRAEAVAIWPGLTQMAELQKRLWAAAASARQSSAAPAGRKKPAPAVLRFAERFDLPVAAQFRRASALDGEHPEFLRRGRPQHQSEAEAPASRAPTSCC